MLRAALSFTTAVLAAGPAHAYQSFLDPRPCADSIRDAANPGACIGASSLPQMGMLYPLGKKLFVSPIGKVGLGTAAPETKVHVFSAGAHCILRLDSAGPSHGEAGLRFRTGRNAADLEGWELFMDDSTLDELGDPDRLGFFHALTGPVMVFDVDGSTGKVGIGTIDPSEKLEVRGNVCVSGGGMYLTCSDERLKENVTDLEGALDKVLRLRGVEFEWRRAEPSAQVSLDGPQIGFLAQEVAEVLPAVVSRGRDGTCSVDYGRLTPVLVEAIQEQQAEIDGLRTAYERLRVRVEQLESVAAELEDVKVKLRTLAARVPPTPERPAGDRAGD